MPKTSKTEEILYNALKKESLHPERQYKISEMHVDFAFPKKKIIVEVDGWMHHIPPQRWIDMARDRRLQKAGWQVFRYDAGQVYNNTAWVVKDIKECQDMPNYKCAWEIVKKEGYKNVVEISNI